MAVPRQSHPPGSSPHADAPGDSRTADDSRAADDSGTADGAGAANPAKAHSDAVRKPNIAKSKVVRALLATASFVCLGLAALGVVLPLLPTTPFVILAAYLYSKSSARWYYWLLNHRIFGPSLRRWQQTGGITTKAKYTALAMIAVTFGFSLGFVVQKAFVKVVLVIVALGVCTFIYRLPETNDSY